MEENGDLFQLGEHCYEGNEQYFEKHRSGYTTSLARLELGAT
jgi:hypothetical protein